jgi:hypothetical protein
MFTKKKKEVSLSMRNLFWNCKESWTLEKRHRFVKFDEIGTKIIINFRTPSLEFEMFRCNLKVNFLRKLNWRKYLFFWEN